VTRKPPQLWQARALAPYVLDRREVQRVDLYLGDPKTVGVTRIELDEHLADLLMIDHNRQVAEAHGAAVKLETLLSAVVAGAVRMLLRDAVRALRPRRRHGLSTAGDSPVGS
jgi:hypothetical protein